MLPVRCCSSGDLFRIIGVMEVFNNRTWEGTEAIPLDSALCNAVG